MKENLTLLLFALLFPSLLAQESKNSGEGETITLEELRDHVFYLGNDELEGRQSGSLGFEKAQQYVVTQLRQADLPPIDKNRNSKRSYYQDFTIHSYLPGQGSRTVITKNGNERSFKDDFIIYADNSFETKELSGGLAFVGAGLREPDYGVDDYNIDVKGKWVVVLGMNAVLPLSIEKKFSPEIIRKYNNGIRDKIEIIIQNAKDAGAIGIITIPTKNMFKSLKESVSPIRVIPGNYQLSWRSSFPIVFIDSTMVDYLFDGEKYDQLTVKEYKSFILKNSKLLLQKEYSLLTISTANVVALVEGSDPVLKNEFIVVGAHLDHLGLRNGVIFNGANDNASGSAAVLEIAEALVKSKPSRSVICILFTGEEMGLLGSGFFTENPPVPLKNIIANVNIEMIGCQTAEVKGLVPIADFSVSSKLKEVIINVGERNKDISFDWTYADAHPSLTSGSDSYSFQMKKIPAVTFTTGFNTDYHKPSDDPEKMNFEILQKSCKLIYEVIVELANRNDILRD